jgi:hypothetical protein
MRYTVEMGRCDPVNPGDDLTSARFYDEELETGLECPFFMTTFAGFQSGRIRVSATNNAGDGPWSEYRYFAFTR